MGKYELFEIATHIGSGNIKSSGFDLKGMTLKFFIQDNKRATQLIDFLAEHPTTLDLIPTDKSGLLSPGNAGYLNLLRR